MNVNQFIKQKERELLQKDQYKSVEPLSATEGSVYREQLLLNVQDDNAQRNIEVEEIELDELIKNHGQSFVRVQFDLATKSNQYMSVYYYLKPL